MDRSSSDRVSARDSLRSFKLLEALRKAQDPGSSQAQELGSQLDAFPDSTPNTQTPLHLAVRCAAIATFPQVLQHRERDLNATDATGSTPLHLACELGRTEIVAILLAQPDIDDMIRDEAGKTCLDRTTLSEPARLIQVSRATFNATYLDHLGTYLNTGNSTDLMSWLKKKRSRCIDFNAKVPQGPRGTTIMHEAARRKDLAILQVAHELGADLLAKDARGKTALDFAKDDKIKSWIRQAISTENQAIRSNGQDGNSSTSTLVGSNTSMPVRKGYLSKWTNVARGYKQRWFVLQNGQLSYYRHKSEEGQASRGSIAMGSAKVAMPADGDKLKFEISSQIAKYKFYVKADHPLEAARWVEDLKLHIAVIGKNGQGMPIVPSGMPTPGTEYGADGGSFPFSYSSTTSLASLAGPEPTHQSLQHKISAKFRKGSGPTSRVASAAKLSADDQMDHVSAYPSVAPSIAPSAEDRDNGSIMTFGADDIGRIPHEENFALLANSTKAQVESTAQLLESFSLNPEATPVIPSSETLGVGRPASIRSSSSSFVPHGEVKEALKQSLSRLTVMIDQYVDMVADREHYWIARYEHEIDAKNLWEQNMQEIAAQHVALENQLERTATKSAARKKELKAYIAGTNSPALPADGNTPDVATPRAPHTARPTPSPRPETPVDATSGLARQVSTVSEDSSDDDEFYEAVETGAVSVKIDQALASPGHKEWPKDMPDMNKEKEIPYEGYRKLRTSLPISVDDRPSVSLWGILKSSIGKDLTKISFPVSFNEPTSMLERMAEDMEFPECLDAAATSEDPTIRIAYVAAFAMSNYSSTLGRIAKPFNPMLGETFEYASFDRQYRYMSEQVSHHPPMSACICQSPRWEYFGEVDAKSKFLGKSFEIRPTGLAHCRLFLDSKLAPNEEASPKGKVEEHYSWKKVTTSVSNFIMGSPTIDHYGDMVVTNHRTGDKCTLTFKPRGWRAGNAFELKGTVTDAQGKVVWELAGRWTKQLVARRAGAGHGELQPDAEIKASDQAEYVLLWKNTEKPSRSPFNLTPYAITLNDKNEALTPWLPPTDCRLRPDLHAFEAGHFEKANELKIGLEEVQRATRKKREAGELPPHKPRWFTRQTDKDSGERYWQWNVGQEDPEYWEERERAGKARQPGQPSEWKNVDEIFGDFALV